MTSAISQKPSRFLFTVLVLISMVGPLGMNIILPSLSSFQKAFATDYAMAQLTLTMYLVAIAGAQLVAGPLSDRFGRRPLILAGLMILMAGSVICYMAASIEMLLAGRMIQAIGGSTGMVMGRAVIRDRCDAETSASVISYLTMAFVIAPSLAPLIGGILEDQFGWQASFVFVFAMASVVLVFAWKGAEESLPPARRQRTGFRSLFLSFAYLLKNPEFLRYALLISFTTASYFGFLAGASFVLVDLMGGTPTELGSWFLMVSVAYIAGNFGTTRLVRRVGLKRNILLGAVISLLGPLLLFMVELTVGLTPFSFFALMAIVALGNGFSIASGMAAAISADPQRVGAAAGLAGFMQVGFGAFSTFVVGALLSWFVTSAVPLLAVMLFCCVMSLIVLLAGTHHRAERA